MIYVRCHGNAALLHLNFGRMVFYWRWSDGCEATAFTLKRSRHMAQRQEEFKEGGDPGVTSPPTDQSDYVMLQTFPEISQKCAKY